MICNEALAWSHILARMAALFSGYALEARANCLHCRHQTGLSVSEVSQKQLSALLC